MNNDDYKKTLDNIRNVLTDNIKSMNYIDTSRMSKKEKYNLIIELQNQIHHLQIELLIRKSVDQRLTLPSGKQIEFSSLSPEQLEYQVKR